MPGRGGATERLLRVAGDGGGVGTRRPTNAGCGMVEIGEFGIGKRDGAMGSSRPTNAGCGMVEIGNWETGIGNSFMRLDGAKHQAKR